MKAHGLVIASSILLASFTVGAAPKSAPVSIAPAPSFDLGSVYDEKESSQMIAKWAKGNRKVAGGRAGFGESDLGGFAPIRDQLLTLADAPGKPGEAMDEQIAKLEAGYDKLPPEAQFFAAQMIMLKPLRGIVWRVRPLFEQKSSRFDFFSGNPGTHSAAVTILRMIQNTTRIYIPTEQSQALFNFLVAPSPKMSVADQFTKVSDYQRFLRYEVYPALIGETRNKVVTVGLAQRLKPLYKPNKPYVWDNKVFYGKGTFDDSIQRYDGFDEAAIQLTAAAVQKSAHDMLVFCAFDQEQLMNLMGALGKLYGVNGFSGNELGITSRARADVYASFRGTGLFNLLPLGDKDDSIGKAYMATALVHLQAYVDLLKTGYDILAAAPENSTTVLNPLFFKPGAVPHMEDGMNKLKAIVDREVPLRSPITGEAIAVNIPKFYGDPPKNLMNLMPNSFQTGPSDLTVKNSKGQILSYRNYSVGRPIGWKRDEWRRLFPDLATDDVSPAFRTLASSYGPNMILGPLGYFID